MLDKTCFAKSEGNRSWRMQQQHIGTFSRAIRGYGHRWHGRSVICSLSIRRHRQDVVASEERQVAEYNQ